MKLSVSAYRAHASAHKKILSSSYQTTLNYGSTAASSSSTPANTLFSMEPITDTQLTATSTLTSCPTATIMSGNSSVGSSASTHHHHLHNAHGQPMTLLSPKTETALSPTGGEAHTTTGSMVTSKEDEEDSSNAASSDCKSPGQRTKSNQRWMKLRTTVQLSSAIQKKPPLKREDSFLKRFSTRQIPETQETMEETGSESASGDHDKSSKRRRRYNQKRRSVVNPDENFYFYWLMVSTVCILYNLWTLIVRQSFPELQELIPNFWFGCDCITDIIFILDIVVQLRTGYLEQGLMVYDDKKLALHYMRSRKFLFDLAALIPLDLLQIRLGTQPLLRFPRFLKVYRSVKFYYIVESRTVWPNLWRVVNLIHILLILAHWFGCFYFLLSEVEGFQGDWVYPYRPGDYATLTRKYLGSLYWSTLTLTTIGDLPTPETNAEYIFTIVSYLIGVFIFATIVGQVGNVITNRNANRLEFERLLDGAKTYMRHHKVPGGMKRRVLRWYDYSWSRGRIQGGGDINTALGLLPDKLKTELALHVNLSVLKKVTIFQECQPEFLHDLVLKMKAYIFTPGDSICRKGEVAREMFIIADGILEVLSETGKVLTTMKAGDFFGEIGILNLDGLNKRTADVRSVGYSELFSLSREDVLAAMKDYPEAQDILQTLGRKRLMEVRCVNKKHAKNVAERESIANKLRSEAKGIKNVLKKSRWATGRRSNESIELQPLHLQKGPKGVLRRMPRVRSDEIHETPADQAQHVQAQHVQAQHVQAHAHEKDKTPSPIGAGLPLLQRLRLLKEKQDREERAVKPAQPMIPSPQNTHVRSAVSPQQSIQEENEQQPDVVGPGLPLIKRLLLLKAKEERIAKETQGKPTQPAVTTISDSVASNAMLISLKATTNTTTSLMAGLMPTSMPAPVASSSVKPKVSFRDRIKSLQHSDSKQVPFVSAMTASSTIADKEHKPTSDDKEKLIEAAPCTASISVVASTSTSGNGRPTKSSGALSFRDKIKQQLGHQHARSEEIQTAQLRPWSKLKLATVLSGGSSYASLNNSFTDSPKHMQHQQQQPLIKIAKIRPTTSARVSIPARQKATTSKSRSATAQKVDSLSVKSSERICTSDSEIRHSEWQSNNKLKFQSRTLKSCGEKKCYRSVDDLSPEYGGLPFVKKLKILNERQKLAELESVMTTRSFSLDCPEWSDGNEPEPLIRSHSEGSGMPRSRISTITTVAPTSYLNTTNTIVAIAPLNIPRSPVSPESNETQERRELKSILKKLSEEKSVATTPSQPNAAINEADELKGLLSAPTVEGYVARHSKFMKSVTFNSTLSSPPQSAHSAIDERSSFPLLSGAQSPNEMTTLIQVEHHKQQQQQQHIQSDQSFLLLPDSINSKASSLEDDVAIADDMFLSQEQLSLSPHQLFESQPQKIEESSPLNGSTNPFISNKIKVKGSIEEHELFSEVLIGIKNVISTHLRDVQLKFEDHFQSLDFEIRQRDVMIDQLQHRILELENGHGSPTNVYIAATSGTGNGSTGSSGDIPFVRGDSLDTIFASSPPPTDSERENRVKSKTKKRSSPRRRHQLEQQQQGSTDQETASYEPVTHLSQLRNSSSMIIDNVTGNITQLSDSVILNIDTSSDTSSSIDDDVHEEEEEGDDDIREEEDEDDDDVDIDDDLNHDNWEIRMLAAELNRRESRRDEPLSSEASEANESSSRQHLHMRSDILDTDTENSELETDRIQRGRARSASFDQQSVPRQRPRGILKAFSFDRDKNQL
ncbi:uncharacterized protein LOC129565282 isoform X3 [Sitodiplosis mosellana]|uniref:uncharacterized protein LOC129565282 isoform X3 n=1 Tax=Sitodiplosis mosellana TaxID=263140 RepID=UPI0024440027|nr:uncharacterized protein LOC129565282 isoform X3 [Sitodiplosis mosellana]XP_055295985.1 uncharacterized protein LOC129565282 isoform X3 [Sitodiplosis mosellana]